MYSIDEFYITKGERLLKYIYFIAASIYILLCITKYYIITSSNAAIGDLTFIVRKNITQGQHIWLETKVNIQIRYVGYGFIETIYYIHYYNICNTFTIYIIIMYVTLHYNIH